MLLVDIISQEHFSLAVMFSPTTFETPSLQLKGTDLYSHKNKCVICIFLGFADQSFNAYPSSFRQKTKVMTCVVWYPFSLTSICIWLTL